MSHTQGYKKWLDSDLRDFAAQQNYRKISKFRKFPTFGLAYGSAQRKS